MRNNGFFASDLADAPGEACTKKPYGTHKLFLGKSQMATHGLPIRAG
jgi:hypothetical protein